MSSIPELADQCSRRYFPGALLGGKIEHDNLELTPGQVDLALIERTLQGVADRNHLLLLSPFASPLEPALIIMSYMKASDPSVPRRINDGRPALLFPYDNPGYIGAIKNFSYTDVVSGSAMYEYDSIGQLDELNDTHCIYSAKTTHVIDIDSEPRSIGLAFVDLRDDTWKRSIADFEAFAEHHHVDSFVFYATDRGYAEETAVELVDEVFEVSRETMVQSAIDTLGTNPTSTRIQETIFKNPIDITIHAAETEKIDQAFNQQYAARQRIIRNYDKTDLIRLINGLLLDLPVPPTRYDGAARKNAFFNTTLELLEGLDDRIAAVSGDEATAFEEFKQQASEVRWALNEQNPRRRLMVEAIETAGEGTQPTVVVVRNRLFQRAVEDMLYGSAGRIPENVEIVARRDLSPSVNAHVVFASAPRHGSPLYEFPPANEITFISYPFLVDSLKSRLQGEISDDEGPTVDITVEIDREVDDEERETDEISLAGIEEDIEPSVTSSSTDNYVSTILSAGAGCKVTFEDGSIMSTYERRQVTVYEQTADGTEVSRIPAAALNSGQKVVIIEEAATDLYERIIEHKHNQDKVAEEEQWAAQWREYLRQAIEDDDSRWDYEALLEEMQDRGSELETEQSIKEWVNGERIGPRDIDDVRIVLSIVNPRFESKYDRIYEAMQYIRVLHQRIGRKVRDHILAELAPDQTAEIETEVDAQLTEIVNQAEIKRVADVTLEY